MADDTEEDELEAGRMPLIDHLIELRNRLMWAFGSVIVTFLVVLTIRSRFRRAPVQSVEEELGLGGGIDAEAAEQVVEG